MIYYQIFCAIAIFLLTFYYYLVSTYDSWKKRNVAGPSPTIIFGNMKDLVFKKQSIAEFLQGLYNEYKHEPLIGIYDRRSPMLIINDLDLIKDVLIRDFSLFADRGIPYFRKVEPLAEHLFLLEAEKWRPLRTKLSPVFTSGKLKDMFRLIAECSEHLKDYLNDIAAKGEPIECRELAAKYTTDVIGSCAFGIDINSLSNEDSEFRRMGQKLFAPTIRQIAQELIRNFLPSLYQLIGHKLQLKEVNEFFTKVVVDTIKYRRENNISRPDFISTLMDLQQHPEKLQDIEVTDTLLTAQAFVFFVAGFETSSVTMAHTFYELAQDQEMQDKLRKEIEESYESNGETLSYEQVKNMKYLDKVFKETLRKYPVLPVLMRHALQNYTFRGTKVSIPKGTKIWIPIYPIHRDPNYYPDPDTFDPERFNDEATASRHPMSYLPFGDGPRNCIGMRFAVYQSKVGIISVLRNYKLDICEKTTIPYEIQKQGFLLTLKGGVHLKITKLQN